jgi:integrase/recombinase XerD
MTDGPDTADTTIPRLPTSVAPGGRRLTPAEYQRLSDVPPEAEWFANIKNKSTKRAYENAIRDFIRFTGIAQPEEFRTVTRAHVIAWRDDLERREIGSPDNRRTPEGATIRHRLAALSSLFEYLCDKNAVTHNPVKASSGPRPRAVKAKHRRSAITRRANCSARPARRPSRRSATAPSCRCCYSTHCGAGNCAS